MLLNDSSVPDNCFVCCKEVDKQLGKESVQKVGAWRASTQVIPGQENG